MIQSTIKWIDRQIEDWPLELKLLLTCLKCWQKERYTELNAFTDKQLHWKTFMSLAIRHRVFPMICQVLGRQKILSVPDPITEQLGTACRSNTLKMMVLTAELARIVDRLQRGSIPVIVLKGPVLSQMLYGDAMLRPARDLDLLIPPAFLERANQLILQSGYQLKEESPDLSNLKMKRYFLKTIHHLEYQRTDKPIVIELHWKLRDRQFLNCDGWNFTTEACRITTVGKISVYHLEDIDNLLYLCAHGFSHGWFRLRWLMDFALQLQAMKPDAGEHLVMKAQEGNVFHLLLPGILLAHRLIGTPLPPSVERFLLSGRRRKLKAILKPSLLFINGPEAWGSPKKGSPKALTPIGKGLVIKKLNGIALHQHFHLQMRYLLNHFLPNQVDLITFRLPNSLFFLYYFLRPVLWGWRNVRARIGGKPQCR